MREGVCTFYLLRNNIYIHRFDNKRTTLKMNSFNKTFFFFFFFFCNTGENKI